MTELPSEAVEMTSEEWEKWVVRFRDTFDAFAKSVDPGGVDSCTIDVGFESVQFRFKHQDERPRCAFRREGSILKVVRPLK